MEAIRQFVKVKNNQVNITLPTDFSADEVEVIIFPSEKKYILSDEQKEILDRRLQEPEENYISAKQSMKYLKEKYGV